ncbi:uncharacterized protein [Triticum aestivum]|uniref:uncharacterized protein n=1 Tax=Triticum aestivum TaxID=4565 RepID=UPI001D02C89C|nr:uncharacterized protein LOC123067767 [Triticum aestivum]
MVEDLINPYNGDWNREVLQNNFLPIDAAAVQMIPLGRMEEDNWAWHLERSGNFSVRSAYRAMLGARQQTNNPASSAGDDRTFWKKLWKMPVPPNVRNFWWRVIRKFIPCRSILKERRIEQISFCEDCGCEETITHSLFDCTWAKLFWHQIRNMLGVKLPRLHPDSWAMDMIDGGMVSDTDAAVILCGCWSVWSERNAKKHGDKGRSIQCSVKWTADVTMDLIISSKEGKKMPTKADDKWRPPEINCIKLNVDASFLADCLQGSTGVGVRDHEGNMGLRNIIVETDALAITKLWNTNNFGRSEIAVVLQETKELSESFQFFVLSYVPRKANELAHLCARQANPHRKRCVWINFIPRFLEACLYKDRNSLS